MNIAEKIFAWRTRVPDTIKAIPASLEDVPQILSLIDYHYRQIGLKIDPLASANHKRLTDPQTYWRDIGGNLWVLKRGERVIGTLAAQPLASDRRIAEFDWYYLAPEAEGKGVSLLLIRRGLEWMVEKGMTTLEFWSGEALKRAHRLYRRLGFIHDGVLRVARPGPPPYHQLYFYKHLGPKEIENWLAKLPRQKDD